MPLFGFRGFRPVLLSFCIKVAEPYDFCLFDTRDKEYCWYEHTVAFSVNELLKNITSTVLKVLIRGKSVLACTSKFSYLTTSKCLSLVGFT